uniref:Uncharacterized protein n=1 Tax=Acrobeloides nanus TaxID=290746 RepID=A0A914EFY0_9BILA
MEIKRVDESHWESQYVIPYYGFILHTTCVEQDQYVVLTGELQTANGDILHTDIDWDMKNCVFRDKSCIMEVGSTAASDVETGEDLTQENIELTHKPVKMLNYVPQVYMVTKHNHWFTKLLRIKFKVGKEECCLNFEKKKSVRRGDGGNQIQFEGETYE